MIWRRGHCARAALPAWRWRVSARRSRSAASLPAWACPGAPIQVVGSDSASRFVQLGIGKSVVIDLPRDIKDVLVAEPKFANAVVRSTRRAYLIGVAVGQTNIYFFDAEGKQIAGFDVAVTRDLNGIRAMLQKLLPNSDVRVDGVGDGVMLSGSVANAAESQQAYDVAARLVGSADKVVNNLTIRGRDQVMLKVTVAEVQRDVIKQLGIDLNGSLQLRHRGAQLQQRQPVHRARPAAGRQATASRHLRATAVQRDAARDGARRRDPHARRAEPDGDLGRERELPGRRRISGPGRLQLRPAAPRICQLAIQFKKFGVGLNFTPVVLSEGRISLKVMTEVSELSNEERDHVGARPSTQTIPAIKTRRAETTVEIPSGGALAMAGMIQEQTKQQISGLARPDAGPGARHAVQEPRLRQPPDRADGDRHALHRARGGAEGPVAAG